LPTCRMRRRGADCPVVVMKVMPVERRGRVIAVELGPTGLYPGGARNLSGRRQPSSGDKSRMMGEYQVWICEGLGVKFPGPTRSSTTMCGRRCISSRVVHLVCDDGSTKRLPRSLRQPGSSQALFVSHEVFRSAKREHAPDIGNSERRINLA
jgi:hypothetical protein